MKAFFIAALVATLSFSATVDDFLESLKQEVLKQIHLLKVSIIKEVKRSFYQNMLERR